MKFGPSIHCRIKSFTVEKGNLLTEPNILKFINIMNYAVKVILSFIGDTFNIEKCCLNRLDLPANYGVIPIFKVCDLTLFVGLTMKKRRNRI